MKIQTNKKKQSAMASKTEMAQQCYTEDSLEPETPTETLAKMIQYSQELQDHGMKLNNQLDRLMDDVKMYNSKAEEQLNLQFQKVEFIIRSWKCEFEQELKDFNRRKKTDVQQQIDHLQELSSSLSKALLRAKVSMAANMEFLTEDHCLSHLEELMEPVQEILDFNVRNPSPTYFIENEGFHMRILKPEDRHQIGYIQHLPLEPKDMLLVQVFNVTQDKGTVVFKAEAYKESFEFEDLLRNSLSWDLKLCDSLENHPSNVKCIWEKGEILFHIKIGSQCTHQFSVYLYNQHILGSPQSFASPNPYIVADQEHPVQVAGPTPGKSTENHYMLSESQKTRGHISRKDISAINLYLEKAKLENSSMEKYRKEAEQHLDGAFQKSEQNESDCDKSLNEAIPISELNISTDNEKRVVRKGRPDTFTPLRRPKSQETVKYITEPEVEAEPDLSLGGTVEFIPTFSSTSKLPLIDDLEVSEPHNESEIRSPSGVPLIMYDRNQLLHWSKSPLAKEVPDNVSKIMGITVKNYEDHEYGKIYNIESCHMENNCDAPDISDNASLEATSSTVGNLTKVLAKAVEVRDPHDIQIYDKFSNIENAKYYNEPTETENLQQEEGHLNDNIIEYEEDFSSGQLFENVITENHGLVKDDNQKVNNHGVANFQDGIFAQLKLKMKLVGENALNKPVGVAQLKNGAVVIADTFNNRMALLSRSGDFIRSFSSPQMKRPAAISVLRDGRFAVKDDHSIIIFTADGEYVEHLRHATHLKYPYGLTMDDNGNLLTIETTKNGELTIVVMEPTGSCGLSRVKVQLGLSKEQAALSKPRFIAHQRNNTILVVDLGLNCIYQIIYSLAEGVVANIIGGYGISKGQFWDPSGIVVDAEGYIMVGDSRNHRIQVFDPKGEFLSFLHLDTPLRRPSGLFLTPCGHLLILNYWENSLAKYKLTL